VSPGAAAGELRYRKNAAKNRGGRGGERPQGEGDARGHCLT